MERAKLGRATFYAHFENKEDLLRSGLDKLRALLTQVSSATEPGRPLAFSLEFFRHVDRHRRLYRALVGREGGTVIDRELRKVLAELIRPELSQSRRQKRDVELAVQYLVGGIMSTVTWWLDYNVSFSPEEVDQAFRRVTLPGLRAVLP